MSDYKKTTFKPNRPAEGAKLASETISGHVEAEPFFEPSVAQRRAKANFWTAWQDDPTLDPELMTADTAARLSGNRTVRRWWGEPGFKPWFMNKDEQRQRLEYLFELSMDAAEDILTNADPKAQGARVQLIKHMSELANKMPSKSGGLGAGLDGMVKAILAMGEVELKALLQKQGAAISMKTANKPKQLEKQAQKTLDTEEEV